MLFLIHDLSAGGAERVYLDYLGRIKTVRVVPVLVRPRGELGGELPAGQRIYHLERGGYEGIQPGEPAWGASYAVGPPRDGLVEGLVSLVVKARRLARIARRESAGLVSTFLHKSHIVALLAKRLWDPRLQVVANIHEQPLQHLETHFPPTRRSLMRWYYRRLLPGADRVLALSESVRSELVRLSVPTELIDVVRNPIDVPYLQGRALAGLDRDALPKGSTPLLVGVGRLEHVKGFDLLIRAFGTASRIAPMRLALVGDGSERARLERLVASLDLAESVSFVGYRDNPLPYISSADLLVVPSRSDAWPNVIGEALAIGTPILATRCSAGIEEFLNNGRFGILVAPEDAEALAQAIVTAIGSAARLRELADLGPTRAGEFDAEVSVGRYESILASVRGTSVTVTA